MFGVKKPSRSGRYGDTRRMKVHQAILTQPFICNWHMQIRLDPFINSRVQKRQGDFAECVRRWCVQLEWQRDCVQSDEAIDDVR